MSEKLQRTAQRCEIIDAVNRVGLGADMRDWKMCREQFADTVRVDYSSLNAEPAKETTADALIGSWKEFFGKTFKTTQHLISNHSVAVDGRTASCHSQVVAHHVMVDSKLSRWTVGGMYTHQLAQIDGTWLVTSITLTLAWEDGKRPF